MSKIRLDDPIMEVKKSLAKLIKESAPKNDFFCSGALRSVPIIRIGDSYTCKFPCNEEAARSLIEYCEEAPFGLGEETVLDKNVRNRWQISKDKFVVCSSPCKILEKSSDKSSILETVRRSLAPDCKKISSELYKLLVYEEGNHFKTHKDTLRSEKHFATLLVFLPSEYEGGDLVVRHMGRECRFNFSMRKDQPLHCRYVAFFTDCEHEVEPVTSGQCLCVHANLQYNLY